MKKTLKIPGFPSEVSETIELPNVGELLMMPMFWIASADDVYKYGGEVNRYLLDKTPLKHDRKYVTIFSYTQWLTPFTRSVTSKTGNDNEWHSDGSGSHFYERDRTHLLLTACSTMTEFNTHEFDVELEDDLGQRDFWVYLNDHATELGLKGRAMEPNKFTTFYRHIHRTVTPKQHEFRFMFRVTESDQWQPDPIEKARIYRTKVFKGEVAYPNIEQRREGLFIHHI